jgi:hypothetical protein
VNRAELLAHIKSLQTPAGGWTEESLASLGVSWPPKKGWLKELLERADDELV